MDKNNNCKGEENDTITTSQIKSETWIEKEHRNGNDQR